MRALALIAVLTLSVALVAGCKSSDKKKDDKTPTGADTPAAGQTPSDGGGDGAALADLEDLASAAAEGATGKVTYKYSTEAGGPSSEGEWTLVQRPPDSRFEIVSTVDGTESRVIVIQTEDKSYVCTSASGSETCLASDQTEGYTAGFSPLFDVPQGIVEGVGNATVDKSEREIAGVNASCFKTDTTLLGGAASEVCFSDNGILLLLRGGSAGSSYTFEATSVSTDVSDSDFEPPYEVIDIPTG